MVRFRGYQISLDRISVPIFRIKRLHESTAGKSKNFNFSKQITSFKYFGAATKKKKKDHA